VQPLGEQLVVSELQQICRQGFATRVQQRRKKVTNQVAELDEGWNVAGVGSKREQQHVTQHQIIIEDSLCFSSEFLENFIGEFVDDVHVGTFIKTEATKRHFLYHHFYL